MTSVIQLGFLDNRRPLVFELTMRAAAWAKTLHLIRRLLPLLGFAAGVASFVLVERQEWLAQWVVGFLLGSWLLLLAEAPLRRWIEARYQVEIPPALLRYGTQALHQEALFFSIPFFVASTDWASSQAGFTGLLFALALISVLDPLYFGAIAERIWALVAFHAFVLFVALLTALPIVLHLDTAQSLQLAAGIMAIAVVPSLAYRLPVFGLRALAPALLGALLLAYAAWALRSAIPPATLRATDIYLTQSFDAEQRQGQALASTLSAGDLQRDGLTAVSAIRAPRGLHEEVEHVWLHEGREVDRIKLAIDGGREQGYRSWSRKRSFPEQVLGQWVLQVETAGGQRIGSLRFEVIP